MALPDVSIAFDGWFLPLTFKKIAQSNVGGRLKEEVTDVNTMGVVQPFSPKMAKTLPEGVYYWEYLQVHCLPDVELELDSYIIYEDKRYKVEAKLDYSKYGYVEYHITESFTKNE